LDEAMKINDWRRKIDAIDVAMLHLLNLRAELALEVGRLKGKRGASLRVPEREGEILSRMLQLNTGPLDDVSVKMIFQAILNESIRTQESNGRGSAEAVAPGRSRSASKRGRVGAA
jgi:chorismate mutase-like protein